ncbi:MAG: fatty-acyl-CoA synthase [Chloroflexi bacterium]|nr:MAG: fatty-acyl-CoA synthase [Chloroflexota bacterium]
MLVTQLSYIHGASDVSLLGDTIGGYFDGVVEAYPDNEAVVSRHQGVRLTYRQLQAEVDRLARALLALGVEKGDRVGIWSPNNVEWIIVQYATAKVGAILVNINPAYRTHELSYVLNQSGVSVLIATAGFRQANYAAMVQEVWSETPGLKQVFIIGPEAPAKMETWDALLERAGQVSGDDLKARGASLQFDDPINIQYTSGTTGFPKGATLSHHNILNNGYFVARRLRLSDKDRLCVPIPFYHCFGMVLGNLGFMTHGATVVIPGESFDAQACLETVQAERCTALYGVPTMFISILAHADFDQYDLSSLRTGAMGGSPCPVEVMRRVIDRMHMEEVTICYGMTETSPVSFQSNTDDDLDRKVSTVGSIHPHVECKIVDPETGQTLPRGATGELCSRGYLVMLYYWENPEATHESIDEGRWMHTGDLAEMREDGYVNIVGRIKDMIIRGGENVYPREIEEFLYTHPQVADVQVIGVPDIKYGEEVCAWVKLKDGEALSEDEVKDFCRGKIATYKIPRYIRFTEQFPMTVTGKVQKFKMREVSVEELGLTQAAQVKTA